MIAPIAAALLAPFPAGQAIEQLAPPLPPTAATVAEQPLARAPASVAVTQLPPDAKPVRQPPPRPAAADADPAARADLNRATAVVLDRGQTPTPELIVRELGPATIAEIVTGVGRDPDPATAGQPPRAPRW